MFYKKILLSTLIVLLGVPAVSFGGSFTYSLMQGKTPSEALGVIASQLEYLTGRVEELEEEQIQQEVEIQNLKEEVQKETSPEPQQPVERASCNRFRAEIENIKQSINIEINALEEQIDELKEKQREAQEEAKSNTPDFGDNKNGGADAQVEWIKKMLEIGDEYEEQIEELEEEVDVLEDKIKETVRPVIEEAETDECLLG